LGDIASRARHSALTVDHRRRAGRRRAQNRKPLGRASWNCCSKRLDELEELEELEQKI
jgi:hypothetical protein